MINIFRKEMKKWNKLLWLILFSMAIASFSAIFFRQPSKKDIEVGRVDNLPIYLDEYQQEVAQLQLQIEMIRNYAQSQGISGDLFLSLYGLNNPAEAAFNELATNKLLDQIHTNLGLALDQKYFVELLGKSVPSQLFDRSGKVDEERFREYLSRMSLTISEYESRKEDEIKRDLVKTFVKNSVYIPKYFLEDKYLQDNSSKSFSILKISPEKFLETIKEEEPSEVTLEEFFQQRREIYRSPEKRKAEYWVFSTKDYEKGVVVDDRAVESFYEKNKSSLFRIPPEVKVRRILFKVKEGESQEIIDSVETKAVEAYKEAKGRPDKFADLAKKYSEDKSSASGGGLVGFFKRGTYEKNFEREAFRLQEKDAITDVFQTKDGFEFLQLVERKNAIYKPLDSVQNEIIKTLKEKKSINFLKGELEAVIYKSRSDKGAIEEFTKGKNMKGEMTEWLSSEDMKGYGIRSLIARNFFTKKGPSRNFGYFSDKDRYILYRETGRESSFIPKFKDVREKILQEYYEYKAKERQKLLVRNIRKDILEGKTTLKDVQKLYDLKFITTKMIKKDAKKVEGIDFEDLPAKAFLLTDKTQLLKLKRDNDYYLVQLEKFDDFDYTGVEEGLKKLISSEKSTKMAFYVGTFIASLVRNAKIEKNEEMLNLR